MKALVSSCDNTIRIICVGKNSENPIYFATDYNYVYYS